MIRISRPSEELALDERTRKYLQRRQKKANNYAARSAAIDKAWKSFLGTKARKKVAGALDDYTHAKCAYCEQVAAKDIEHFYPKTDYPDRMFRGTNYLRGCKNCNNAKRDRFPVNEGVALLIDPCAEEPLSFFVWDSLTGKMALNPNEPFHTRARTTRDLFDLDQEPLDEERRQKLLDVKYLLARVVDENPVTAQTKDRLHDQLRSARPWLGIVRQLLRKPGPYGQLVEEALQKLPEINQWTVEWL